MRLTDIACMPDITGKNNEFFYIKDNQKITDDEILNKLGQLEDIEDELGIDLITLFKALTSNFYVRHGDRIFKTKMAQNKNTDTENCLSYGSFDIDGIRYGWLDIRCCSYDEENNMLHNETLKLKDYGKTWALTKEELINE